MKSDASSLPQRHVALKGSDRLLLPAIGRVVELDEERIPAQESVVERVGVLNIIHSEIAVRGQLVDPSPGSLRVREVMSAILVEGEDTEFWIGGSGRSRTGRTKGEKGYKEE